MENIYLRKVEIRFTNIIIYSLWKRVDRLCRVMEEKGYTAHLIKIVQNTYNITSFTKTVGVE